MAAALMVQTPAVSCRRRPTRPRGLNVEQQVADGLEKLRAKSTRQEASSRAVPHQKVIILRTFYQCLTHLLIWRAFAFKCTNKTNKASANVR